MGGIDNDTTMTESTTTNNSTNSTENDATDNATKSTAKASTCSEDHVKPSEPNTDTSSDASLLLLDRLHHNATLYPNKRAMAFVTSTTSSSTSPSPYNVKIEREISYAEFEYETDRLAASLLEEHQIAKGDRYVIIKGYFACVALHESHSLHKPSHYLLNYYFMN